MKRNSSALDEPNTPPCSILTTYRAPSPSSTYQLARELPVAIRRSSTIGESSDRWLASHGSSAAASCSVIDPSPEGGDERRRHRQFVVELTHHHRAQQFAHRSRITVAAS